MLAVTAVAFLMFRFVGDPVAIMAREDATVAEKQETAHGARPRPAHRRAVRPLRRPGRLRRFRHQLPQPAPVTELIAERLPATLELVFVATILSLALGIPLGVLCALQAGRRSSRGSSRRSRWSASRRRPSSPASCSSSSSPCRCGWLPSFGRGDVVRDRLVDDRLPHAERAQSLILPAASRSRSTQLTLIMRLVRSEMIDVLSTRLHPLRRARGLPDALHPFPPRAAQRADAGHHRDGPADRLADRLRDRHRDGVPVAGHGPALHPGGELRRYPGDGGLSALRRLPLRRRSTRWSTCSMRSSIRACGRGPHEHARLSRPLRRVGAPLSVHARRARWRVLLVGCALLAPLDRAPRTRPISPPTTSPMPRFRRPSRPTATRASCSAPTTRAATSSRRSSTARASRSSSAAAPCCVAATLGVAARACSPAISAAGRRRRSCASATSS